MQFVFSIWKNDVAAALIFENVMGLLFRGLGSAWLRLRSVAMVQANRGRYNYSRGVARADYDCGLVGDTVPSGCGCAAVIKIYGN